MFLNITLLSYIDYFVYLENGVGSQVVEVPGQVSGW